MEISGWTGIDVQHQSRPELGVLGDGGGLGDNGRSGGCGVPLGLDEERARCVEVDLVLLEEVVPDRRNVLGPVRTDPAYLVALYLTDVLVLEVRVHRYVSLEPLLADRALEAGLVLQLLLPGLVCRRHRRRRGCRR